MAGSGKNKSARRGAKAVEAEEKTQGVKIVPGTQPQITDSNASAQNSDPDGSQKLKNETTAHGAESKETGPAATRHAKKSGILGPLVGGVLAGSIGFLVAQYLGNDHWPFQNDTAVTDELSEKIRAQNQLVVNNSEALVSLDAGLSEIAVDLGNKTDSATLENLIAGQQQADQKTLDLAETLSRLDARLVDLENRPIPDVGATKQAVELYSTELAAMRQMLDSELAKIAAAQDVELANIAKAQAEVSQGRDSATEIARVGLVQSAMAELRNASINGATFVNPLANLERAGVTISDALQSAAQDGIPTLADLSRNFPIAARSSLAAAAQDASSSSSSGGLTGFLRNQLGVRSLEPRQGDSVDAVLSRAEAFVDSGDITQALKELDLLTGSARQEMRAWAETAVSHQETLAEIAMLSASVEE